MAYRRGRLVASYFRAGCWCLFLYLFIPASPLEAQPDSLPARLRERGTVRVIVHVNVPGYRILAGAVEAREAISQRAAIRHRQDGILTRLVAVGVGSVKRFKHVPYLSLEVDAAGLAALLEDPDVLDVVEDQPEPPMLESSVPIVGADAAWSKGFDGTGQVVSVLDTGVDKYHSFFGGRVLSEACYSTTSTANMSSSLCPGGAESSTEPGSGMYCDPSIHACDHGTHVAGIIAGNGESFSGVAKGAGLIAIQVFSRFDSTSICGVAPCVLSYISDQILAMERVLDLTSSFDIASANLSLGGGRYTDQAQCDLDNAARKAAIDSLRAAGVAVIIAAGNSGYDDALSAPGCISTAVSVGSTSDTDEVSPFSNEAAFLSLFAPGEDITSSVLFDQFSSKNGTSMATPHVAGAWAILRQAKPDAAIEDVLQALDSTGKPIPSRSGGFTTPRIRIADALDVLNPSSDPHMQIEDPLSGATIPPHYRMVGWALDLAADAGTGIDWIDVWAHPLGGGAPTYLGPASLGIPRPDIAATFGPQFETSGFELPIPAAIAGRYQIRAWAHSTVSGTFNNKASVDVDIEAYSDPRMSVKTPLPGEVVSLPFEVSGWAVDLGATVGTGVDWVDVWAFPFSGPPIYVGAATLGGARPDVADFFGDARFEPSGFNLPVTSLPPGAFELRIWAHSTVSGGFNNLRRIPVTSP